MRPVTHCGLNSTSLVRVITYSAAGPGRRYKRFTHSPEHGRCCHPASLERAKAQHFTCQASVLEVLAFVPGVCFDRECQEAADKAFLIVTAVPLLGLVAAVVLKFRPASTEELNSEQVATTHTLPQTA